MAKLSILLLPARQLRCYTRFKMRKFFPAIVLLIFILTCSFQRPASLHSLTEDIYTDSLAAGWSDWSWGVVNLNAASPVHSGNHSISVQLAAWQGLYLQNAGVNSLGVTHLRFFIHGGSLGAQQINIYLVLEVNGSSQNGPSIALNPPVAGVWDEVQIPLTDMNPEGEKVTGIIWQSNSASNQPVFYLDDIALISSDDPNAPQVINFSISPRSLAADNQSKIVIKASLNDPQGLADITRVSVEPFLPAQAAFILHDDGISNDGIAADGVYGGAFSLPAGTIPAEYQLLLTAEDQSLHTTSQPLGTIVVLSPAGGEIPSSLPGRIGWGSNQWSEVNGDDWQVNSGVAWDYVYQYITYGWESWGNDFVQRFVSQAWDKSYIPAVTVYLILGTPPTCGESPLCYASKLQNASAVNDYINSLEGAARQANGTQPVIFILEPDFYGYMQQLSNDPSNRPAGVIANTPSSYPVALNRSGYANNLAGFGQFIVDRIHQLAPNALAAPMASMWAVNGDPQNGTASQAKAMAQSAASFIDAMGGSHADLLTVEFSDRDAGFYEVLQGRNTWWDDADLTLPRVNRAFFWENVLSTSSNKRLLLWQVPVGNMNLNNTCDNYRDNRAAYLFNHARDAFDSGVIAVMFGGGADCTTNVNSDGGFVAAQGLTAYAVPPKPINLHLLSLNEPIVRLGWEELDVADLWGYSVYYQLNSAGPIYRQFVSRSNNVNLFLPQAGTWNLWVTSSDAMSQESAPSNIIAVEINFESAHVYLPITAR